MENVDLGVDYVIFGFDKSIRTCPYCEKAKELLDDLEMGYMFSNVVFTKDISNKEEVNQSRKMLMELLGVESLGGLTFPQVFEVVTANDGHELVHVGGFTELKEKMNEVH